MSTTLLTAVAALLVFSPVLIELVRLTARLARRVLTRAPAVEEVPDYGATFEASVHESLYGGGPRWRRLEVSAPPQARPDATPPVLRPVPAATDTDPGDRYSGGAVRAA